MNSTMTVLKIMPGRKPERVSIPHTLESMQELVGGCIQAIYPYKDPVAIICNEEGKLMGMDPNRAVRIQIPMKSRTSSADRSLSAD